LLKPLGMVKAGVLFGVLSLAGCAEFYRPETGPRGEAHRPVLEAVWAQPEIGEREFWRIYVRASDPDGDLDAVFITFDQHGATYAGELLILPASQRRRANGAVEVYTDMKDGSGGLAVYGTARVHVLDRAGNRSEAKTFSFAVLGSPRADAGAPPQGFERGVTLGRAEFPLRWVIPAF